MSIAIRSLPERRMVSPARLDLRDKATIVSIFHAVIEERKPTVFPGYWRIEAGSYEKPSILVVHPSATYYDTDPHMPILGIPISAVEVANSVVQDWCNHVMEAVIGDRGPGVFWIERELDPDPLKAMIILKKDYKHMLDDAKARQERWYERLITVADYLYATTGGSPIAVSSDMRFAAHYFGLNDKPWLANFAAVAKIKCVACGNLRDPGFPICPSCQRVVDKALADKLGISLAVK